jgi:hypothetical protein
MHEECHWFAANSEIAIIQEDYEELKSRQLIKDHEERKQISIDQWDLKADQFFQKSTSISWQMSLQNQTRKTRRDSTLQSAMNSLKFRTSRKAKLYEDVRLDD